ncbi:MAG: VCBS repeat-containing protein [Kofleriaceae bacterium]|nr:VCBS repeat-containing protein [Kofleriaceae bacterium]
MARALAPALTLLVACADASVLVQVASDRPVGPGQVGGLDAICVAAADDDPAGRHHGAVTRLVGAFSSLPQTLRVSAAEASAARVWAVGYSGGVPAARASARTDFEDDLTLRLDRCGAGRAGPPTARPQLAGPADAVLAPLLGRTGWQVLAVGQTSAELLDVVDGAWVRTPAPAPPGPAVRTVVVVDLDGDCDDDVVVVDPSAPPALWLVEGSEVSVAGSLGAGAAAAVAAADVDRDGDVDLVTGAGADLALHRNDGAGRFALVDGAIITAGLVTDVRTLASGDLDGDGSPDLVVGQAAAPIRALFGDGAGAGTFLAAALALPEVALTVTSLVLADTDGDLDPDLWVGLAAAPIRLYGNRAGLFDDQSFALLPQPAPTARALAAGSWDDACAPDAVLASDGGSTLLRGGGDGGRLISAGSGPAGGSVVLVDLDDDGAGDVVIAGAAGVAWLAP